MGALTWGLPWAILWGLQCPMDKGCLRAWWGMGSSGSWAETGRLQSHVSWKRPLRSSPVINPALPSQPEPCTPLPPFGLYLLDSVRMVPTPAPSRHHSSPGLWHNQRWSLHSSPQQGIHSRWKHWGCHCQRGKESCHEFFLSTARVNTITLNTHLFILGQSCSPL